jgi:hypothetical protein
MELSDATEKTPAITGIDIGTFRLVPQCLNHCATTGINLIILTLCIGLKTIFIKFQFLSAISVSNCRTHSLYPHVRSASISKYNYILFLRIGCIFHVVCEVIVRFYEMTN